MTAKKIDASPLAKRQLLDIPLDQIKPDPKQPRKVFDQAALEELAESIKEHGVIQAIGVYQNGDGRYIIKHGERRWRASKIAKQTTIPAIVGDPPDALANRLHQFVENDQREGLNVIEEALFYREMIEVEGLSKIELSRRLGRGGNTTFITNALIWLECEEEIRTAVAAKRLPKDVRVAKALLSVPDQQARVKLAVALASRKAGISACISAAHNLTKKLQKPQGKNVRTPAITLGLNGRPPAGSKLDWDGIRQSAQAMCDQCTLKDLAKHPEPAWVLVFEAAQKTCDDCTARNGRDLQICRECPGVAIIKQLAGVAHD